MKGSLKGAGKPAKSASSVTPSKQADLRNFFGRQAPSAPKPSSTPPSISSPTPQAAPLPSLFRKEKSVPQLSSKLSENAKKRPGDTIAVDGADFPSKRTKVAETKSATPPNDDRRASLVPGPKKSPHKADSDAWLEGFFGDDSEDHHNHPTKPISPINRPSAPAVSTSFSFDLGDDDLLEIPAVDTSNEQKIKFEPTPAVTSTFTQHQRPEPAPVKVEPKAEPKTEPEEIFIEEDDPDFEDLRPVPYPSSASTPKRLSLAPKTEPQVKQERKDTGFVPPQPSPKVAIPREVLPAKLMSQESQSEGSPVKPQRAQSATSMLMGSQHQFKFPEEFTDLGSSMDEFEQFRSWVLSPESGIECVVFAGIFARGDTSSFRLTEEAERKVATLQCRAIALLFPIQDGSAAAGIPLDDGAHEVPLELRKQLVFQIFEESRISRKICYNSKQLFKTLLPLFDGEIRPTRIFDIQLAAYVFDPELSDGFSFHNICKLFLRQEPKHPTSIGSSSGTVITEDLKIAEKVAAVLEKRLLEERLWEVFWDQECRVSILLAAMEATGIAFDTNALGQVSVRLTERMRELQALASQKCGFQVNLASPKSISEALYTKLNLKPTTVSSSKTRGGSNSTNEDALKSLQKVHELPGIVLAYRKAQKLLTTYVDKLGHMTQKDGRIHTLWDQMGTGTGRLSSRDPNLQNIPRVPYTFKSTDSRKVGAQEVTVSVSIRSAFVAGDGMVLVGADYSQLEMRLLAHVAEDKTLEMFFSSGKDVHSQVASHWKKKSVDQVLPQEREYAKRLVYGIMYGMGAKALADHLSVTQQDARKFMNEFMSSYPAVKKWIDKTIAEAKRNHHVRTLYGRRRLLVADGDDASRADRQAVNSIVQGTAADIVKQAMLAIDDAIRGTHTRLLLQIHDELIYECRQSDAKHVLGIIRDCMEKVATLRVPLPVSLKMGKSWANLEPVKLDDPTAFDHASQASQVALPAVNEYVPVGNELDDDIDDIFDDV